MKFSKRSATRRGGRRSRRARTSARAPDNVYQSLISSTAVTGRNIYGIPGNVPAGASVRLSTVRITFASATPCIVQACIYNPDTDTPVVVSNFRILTNGTRSITLKTPRNIPYFVAQSGQDWWEIRCSVGISFVANNTWVARSSLLPISSFLGFAGVSSPDDTISSEDVDQSSTD